MTAALVLSRPGLIKICGLRRPEDAMAAVSAGADLLGFMFAPSTRRVTPEVAATCVAAVRGVADRRILAVGVFVDASVEEVTEAVEVAGLDVVQLHGERGDLSAAELAWPMIRPLRFGPGTAAAAVIATVRRDRERANPPLVWMLDGYHPTVHGGTGLLADWTLAASVAGEVPLLLAGGLTPVNVAEAIGRVGPHGVDVSGGVERDGVKDRALIASFVAAARAAFEERRNVGRQAQVVETASRSVEGGGEQ